MEPEKDRLRTWREDKAQQKAFAKSVQAYGRRRGFGDADVEDGMAAAAEILRQRGRAGSTRRARMTLDRRAAIDPAVLGPQHQLSGPRIDQPAVLVAGV